MYKTPVTPAINLLFTPKKNIQVRASYTKGYRAPSLKELYLHFFDANHRIQGNPDIKPENSNHIQLSASYQAYENKADYLQFSFSSNYNEVNNGIALVPLRPEDSTSIDYQYGNINHLSNLINTFQIDGQWNNFHLQTGVAYAYTFEEKGNYNAFGSMEANAMLQYAWRKTATNFNIYYKFSSAQPMLITGIDGSVSYNGRQGALSMVDVSAEKRLYKNKVQIVAGIKNLLNVDRRQTSGLISGGGSHSGGSATNFFMPRSFFTSLHFTID
jgi:outer membrane receptor for ferrienterochelin and colicins